MPAATVTVRELKNKETGLDISIPNYKEIPGLLGGTVEYNVVVVSNLSYFKSPKHKESDVVQFMISKKYGELEDFFKRLNDKFSGTAFPPLPKKAFLMSEAVIRERRASLEHFLKFIAVVPKIVNSPLFLEFLGVNAIKAGKFKSGEEPAGKETTETETEKTEPEEKQEDVFDEEEEDKELFAEEEQEDEELFPSSQSGKTEQTQMYEEPDLGGGIDKDEGQDLFLPEAKVKPEVKFMVKVPTSAEDTETSELLRIEDDLEELLQLKPKKNVEKQTEIPEKTKPIPVPRKLKPQTSSKPSIPTKPKPDSAKPLVPERKPKPVLPSKPKPKEDNSALAESNIPKDNVETDLSNDDIMKYITENSSADVDLDLF